MDWKCYLLARNGYEIVNVNGSYCLAFHSGQEVLLRWNGERWLIL